MAVIFHGIETYEHEKNLKGNSLDSHRPIPIDVSLLSRQYPDTSQTRTDFRLMNDPIPYSDQASTLWNRRTFLKTLSLTSVAAGCGQLSAAFSKSHPDPSNPPRVALLATEVRRHSHAQHFIDRLLEGYGWHGEHYYPRIKLTSLYVDQFPETDLARDRERRHGVPIYPTIAEALTQGGNKLDVDGVIIIAEHGDYPNNDKGQKRYPRYRFFKEMIEVFESSGRSVPVFNDKHLSTDWNECVEMVEDSKRLDFAFLAGSSLPVTWRIPSVDIPWNADLHESVSVCYGGIDSYDIHGLETAQCMSERRAGGETGVKSVHAVRGADIWPLLEKRDSTRELLMAALARSHQCKAPNEWSFKPPTLDWIQQASPGAVAYFIEHNDGFKTTLFMLNGLVLDFTYAGMMGNGKITSCQMHLPMPPRQTTTADFFNPLSHRIEETILSGKATYPPERTLLTSGMTLFGVESLYRGEVKLNTPELDVQYQVEPLSTYWRG
jgi:hypothetical protein